MNLSSTKLNLNTDAKGVLSPQFQVFSQLSRNDKNARRKAAEDSTSSAAYLAELASDESYEVRILVSENPMTPLPILELLADDQHPDVRYAMAENANLPSHILRMLVHDENPYVSNRASKTLERIKNLNIAPLRNCA
jgi:hypothetical protein